MIKLCIEVKCGFFYEGPSLLKVKKFWGFASLLDHIYITRSTTTSTNNFKNIK
jgi:hypothetical protein